MSVTIASALTVRECASRFNVSIPVVLSWISNDSLHAIDVSSNPGVGRPTWRIPESAIVDFSLRKSKKKSVKPARRKRRKKDSDFVTYF
jgi:transposase